MSRLPKVISQLLILLIIINFLFSSLWTLNKKKLLIIQSEKLITKQKKCQSAKSVKWNSFILNDLFFGSLYIVETMYSYSNYIVVAR